MVLPFSFPTRRVRFMFCDPAVMASSVTLGVPWGQRPARSASYLCIVGAQWMPGVELSYIRCKLLQVSYPQLKHSMLLQTWSSLWISNVCFLLFSIVHVTVFSSLSIPLWLHYLCTAFKEFFQYVLFLQLNFKNVASVGGHLSEPLFQYRNLFYAISCPLLASLPIKMVGDGRLAA